MRSYNGFRGVNRRSELTRRLRKRVAKFVALKTCLGLPDLSSPYLCQALVLIRTAGCVVLLRSKTKRQNTGTITVTLTVLESLSALSDAHCAPVVAGFVLGTTVKSRNDRGLWRQLLAEFHTLF